MVSRTAHATLGPEDPVVVVGAGIVGCSAAFHLLRSGARQVTLIDATEPGGGTTPAGAGFVALWAAGEFPLGRSGIELERYGLEFYRELATSGADIGYRSNGNLVLALTDGGAAGRPAAILSDPEASPGTRWLSREEVCTRAGVIAPDAIAGGVLMPSGIQVNAGHAVQAIKQLVAAAGGTILEAAPATGFVTAQGRVRSVRTPAGDIDAAGVVIAAGAWTNQVLGYLDRWLPLIRVVATRVVTDDAGVPETLPTVQCPEAGLWIREMDGAFTWGTVPGYELAYLFEQREGTLGWGRPHSERLLRQVLDTQAAISKIFPRLRDAAVNSWLQGIVTYTADQRFFIGHVSGFDNAVVVAGDNESGVSHGPGMGRAGAELVRGESPFVDVKPFLPGRFAAAGRSTEETIARDRAATQGWFPGFESE
jgi:sarcosine oxidase, subunit beta